MLYRSCFRPSLHASLHQEITLIRQQGQRYHCTGCNRTDSIRPATPPSLYKIENDTCDYCNMNNLDWTLDCSRRRHIRVSCKGSLLGGPDVRIGGTCGRSSILTEFGCIRPCEYEVRSRLFCKCLDRHCQSSVLFACWLGLTYGANNKATEET